MMSGQCLSSSSLPGSLDSCPHCPRERMRTRISTLTVWGAPHAQPPRPPRVVLAPRALEPEEGLPLTPESSPGAPRPGSPCSIPAHVPGGRNVTPHRVPGAAAPVTLQRVPETLGSEGMWEQGAGGRWGGRDRDMGSGTCSLASRPLAGSEWEKPPQPGATGRTIGFRPFEWTLAGSSLRDADIVS